ncbi:hypothetical protein VKT23_017941 [Stygiomarasmius scandens]|uniref:mitogen-activated protein kinase kinase kinase n=1 Tax=Marasmiellus scandens TaxID=2682957 RepID=A0ABR1IQK4_9AGAR
MTLLDARGSVQLENSSSLHTNDADLAFLQSTYGISDPQPSTNIIVEFDFNATRPDELVVKSGQTVCVLHSFKDHWSLCKNDEGTLGMVPSDRLGLVDLPARPKRAGDGRPRSPSTLPRLTSVTLRPRNLKTGSSNRNSVLHLLEFLQSTRRRVGSGNVETFSSRVKRGPFSVLKGGKNPRNAKTGSKSSRRVKFSSPISRETIIQKSDARDVSTDSNEATMSSTSNISHGRENASRSVSPASQYSQDSGENILAVIDETDIEELTPETSESSRASTPSSHTSHEAYTPDLLHTAQKQIQNMPQLAVDLTGLTTLPGSRSFFRDSISSRRMVYRNLLSVLIGETLPIDTLWTTLQDCLSFLRSLDLVSSLVHCNEYRVKLLKAASELNISEDPMIRKALQEDENEIAEILHLVSLSEVSRRAVLALEGDDAQKFLDVVQDVLDKGHLLNPEEGLRARHLLVRLSERCYKLPSSLFIKGVVRPDKEEHAVYGGGYGDVFRALLDGQVVALKRMRIFQRDSGTPRTRRRFCREALVWRQLNNTFIVPFLGIDAETFPSYLCMVSPWMRHGTILKHIGEHGRAHVDNRLHEIAQGLAYLHSRNIIHGDLRGANILINDNWQACLTDFGLTVFDDITPVSFTSRREGSARWMAPELFVPESFGLDRFRLTTKTDVYAFGCVCFELYTGRSPFSEFAHDTAVMLKVVKGERPKRPTGENEMEDELWDVVDRCWKQEHQERQTAAELVECIGNIVEPDSRLQQPEPLVIDPDNVPQANEGQEESKELHPLEPEKSLHEKLSLETLSVHRLSSFPFVTADPFASFSSFPPPTPDSPLLPSISEEDDVHGLAEVLLVQELDSAASVPESLAVEDLPQASEKLSSRESPVVQDCILAEDNGPSARKSSVETSECATSTGKELSNIWRDCLQMYQDTIQEDSLNPDSSSTSQQSDTHLLETLQTELDYDMGKLLGELDGFAEENGQASVSSSSSKSDRIPRSLLAALWPDELLPVISSEYSEFKHELDVAFGSDFSLGELQQSVDLTNQQPKVDPQVLTQKMTRAKPSRVRVITYEFLCIFLVAILIYIIMLYVCFGDLFWQAIVMHMC